MAFTSSVEQWRNQILQYVPNPAGGVDYWLAWLSRESGGNICSYTSYHESGLFQLMPPDNTNAGHTTEAALRSMCVPGSQTKARAPTDAEVQEQMVSFSYYLDSIINAVRSKLAAVGAQWDETDPDFWRMVKMQHALPGPIAPWLKAAASGLGRPPASWSEIQPYAGVAKMPQKWIDNASWVGAFGGDKTFTARVLTATIVPTENATTFFVSMLGLAAGSALAYFVGKRYLHSS